MGKGRITDVTACIFLRCVMITFMPCATHFCRGIEEAPKSSDITERGHHLNEYFTYSLYVNICRSLFERHKLMFSLLLAVKILQNRDYIDAKEWR